MSDLAAYHELIARKRVSFEARGLKRWGDLPPSLFPHQKHGVELAFALRFARLCFTTPAFGKTRIAHSWAQQIIEATNKPALLLSPLAVGPQHAREADEIGIDAKVIRSGAEVDGARIYIINYDRLDKIDPADFGAVILDESSIIKNFTAPQRGRLFRPSIGRRTGWPARRRQPRTIIPNSDGIRHSLASWTRRKCFPAGLLQIRPKWAAIGSRRPVSVPIGIGSQAGRAASRNRPILAFPMPVLRCRNSSRIATRFARTCRLRQARKKTVRRGFSAFLKCPRPRSIVRSVSALAARADIIASVVAAEPDEPLDFMGRYERRGRTR